MALLIRRWRGWPRSRPSWTWLIVCRWVPSWTCWHSTFFFENTAFYHRRTISRFLERFHNIMHSSLFKRGIPITWAISEHILTTCWPHFDHSLFHASLFFFHFPRWHDPEMWEHMVDWTWRIPSHGQGNLIHFVVCIFVCMFVALLCPLGYLNYIWAKINRSRLNSHIIRMCI